MRNPLVLLLAVGALLAVNLALVKAAAISGVSPLGGAVISTLGAGVVILGLATLHRGRPPELRGRLGFFVGAGAISYAFPNALIFLAADRVGSSYAAILYAFVPGLTYLIALVSGIDRWSLRRMAGLMIGLVGAVVVVSARFGLAAPDQAFWLIAALAAPVSVAAGNVARSRYWPPGATAFDVAPGLLISAGLLLAAALPFGSSAVALAPGGAVIAVLMLVVASVFYSLYFTLQHRAGAVYLSQIGYVAAGVGLLIGVTFYDEPLNDWMLAGLALVVFGVVLVRPARGEIASSPQGEAAKLAGPSSREFAT
jgi:drug/metabolite transporter (DMT)-like permease